MRLVHLSLALFLVDFSAVLAAETFEAGREQLLALLIQCGLGDSLVAGMECAVSPFESASTHLSSLFIRHLCSIRYCINLLPRLRQKCFNLLSYLWCKTGYFPIITRYRYEWMEFEYCQRLDLKKAQPISA